MEVLEMKNNKPLVMITDNVVALSKNGGTYKIYPLLWCKKIEEKIPVIYKYEGKLYVGLLNRYFKEDKDNLIINLDDGTTIRVPINDTKMFSVHPKKRGEFVFELFK